MQLGWGKHDKMPAICMTLDTCLGRFISAIMRLYKVTTVSGVGPIQQHHRQTKPFALGAGVFFIVADVGNNTTDKYLLHEDVSKVVSQED